MKVFYKVTGLFLLHLWPLLISFLVFEGHTPYFIFIFGLIVFYLIFTFADKILLLHINAREIIDSDRSELFQIMKNEAFRLKIPVPRVYVYTGTGKNILVLKGQNEWSIVIDREVFNIYKSNQLKSTVEYVFRFQNNKECWLQTKGMGLIAFDIYLMKKIVNLLTFKINHSKIIQLANHLAFLFIVPMINTLFALARMHKNIEADEELRAIYHFNIDRSDKSILGLSITQALQKDNIEHVIIKMAEEFPVLSLANYKVENL